ncbi:MAG: hypothetical protein HC880_12610 [Bacteroidia bacterium]|nr:hypothetical protein [Bacteroidia bacterium]
MKNKKNIEPRFYFLKLNILLLCWAIISSQKLLAYTDFSVRDVSPEPNKIDVVTDAFITVSFSDPVEPSSVNLQTLIVRSTLLGIVDGEMIPQDANTIRFQPTAPFKPGDLIQVTLTNRVLSTAGIALTPFTFRFLIKTQEAPAKFTEYKTCTSSGRIDTFFPADFDGDQDIDIAYGMRDINTIGFYYNKGDLEFEDSRNPLTRILQAPGVNFIHAGDLNNDHSLDIVASLSSIGFVYYLNDGQGRFSNNFKKINQTNFSGNRSVYAVDLDSDGDVDVLGANNNQLFYYKNQGVEASGEQIIFEEIIIDPNVGGGEQIITADLNNDGRLEIIVAAQNTSRIVIIDYDTDKEDIVAKYPLSGAARVSSVYAANLDKDATGYVDIVAAALNSNQFLRYDNIRGTFEFTPPKDIDNMATEASFVHAGDINGDAFIDIVGSTLQGKNIVSYLNQNGLNFLENPVFNTINGAESLYTVDLDDDGDLDIITSSKTDGQVYWYINGNYEGPSPIRGKNSTCVNTPETYSMVATSGYSYLWRAEGGTIIDANNLGVKDGDSIQVIWNSSNDKGILWLEARSACAVVPDILNIEVFIRSPKVDFEVGSAVCVGEPRLYQMSTLPTDSDNIYWALAGEKGQFVNNDSTGSAIRIEWLEPGTDSITLYRVDAEGCQNRITKKVTINPVPPIDTIFGERVVCLENPKTETYNIASTNDLLKWEATGGIIEGPNNENVVRIRWQEAGSHRLSLARRNSQTLCEAKEDIEIDAYKKTADHNCY